jgi:hypothetical protein
VATTPEAAEVTGSLADTTASAVELATPVTASVVLEIVCVTASLAPVPESGWAVDGSTVVAWGVASTVPSTVVTDGVGATVSGDATDWVVGSADVTAPAASVGDAVGVAASGAGVTAVVTGSAGVGATVGSVVGAAVCATASAG